MFKLTSTPTFTAPVTANIPADRGKFTKVTFYVEFKRPSLSEYQDLMRRLQESRAEAEARPTETPRFGDRQFVDEVLHGFGTDLQDEDGTPMAFSPGNVDRLCEIYPIQSRIVASFFEHYGQAAAKN